MGLTGATAQGNLKSGQISACMHTACSSQHPKTRQTVMVQMLVLQVIHQLHS